VKYCRIFVPKDGFLKITIFEAGISIVSSGNYEASKHVKINVNKIYIYFHVWNKIWELSPLEAWGIHLLHLI
jgi:hypothetical protein